MKHSRRLQRWACIALSLTTLILAGCATPPPTQAHADRPATRQQLANGQLLAYRAILSPDSQTGTPILFIHGIPDASDSWLPIMQTLSARHPVYAVDLAGYGYSDWPDGHDLSLSAQADYLQEFIASRGLDHVILVGHDIGGGVAQIIAVRHPEHVSQLVLIDSTIGRNWPAWEVRLLRTPGIGPAGFAVFEDLLWAYLLHKGLDNDQLLDAKLMARYRHWWQGAAGRQRLIRNARALDNRDLADLQPPVTTLAVPTLILWAREDRFLDAHPAQALCAAMADCRFEFIEAAGHFLLDEQPDSVAAHIGGHIDAITGGNATAAIASRATPP